MNTTAAEITIKMSEAMPKIGAWIDAARPAYIMAGRVTYAMIEAHVKFQGRDRRRIKREVNKAVRKARLSARAAN